MFCMKLGRHCQHTGCNENYKVCEPLKNPLANIGFPRESWEQRIAKLEQEIQLLKAENMNLRNRLNAAPPYYPKY